MLVNPLRAKNAELAGFMTAKAEQEKSSSRFEEFLQTVSGENTQSSDANSKVSEEQLFAAIIAERLNKLETEDGLKLYQEQLKANLERFKNSAGFASHERAAKSALQTVVEKQLLSKEQAEILIAQSFKAAQLDQNHDALYDSIGGPNDASVAVAEFSTALKQAQNMLSSFDSKDLDAGVMSINYHSAGIPHSISTVNSSINQGKDPADSNSKTESTNSIKGNYVDGAEGFLFKPASDSDGRLVILAPKALTGEIERVVIKNQNGKIIEEGRFTSIANGDREHFRFNKPGSAYPDKLIVEMELSSGKKETWQINDPSKRYD